MGWAYAPCKGITMPFNSEGMYRGYVTDTEKFIGIYKED